MRRFRGLVVGAGAVLGLGLAGCGNGAPTTSSSGGNQASCPGSAAAGNLGSPAVKVAATDQLTFSPASETAKVGQVIEWSNTGTVQHTVTFDEASCLTDSSIVPGATWQIKFTKPGTYPYHCTIHPGMDGTLTVSS